MAATDISYVPASVFVRVWRDMGITNVLHWDDWANLRQVSKEMKDAIGGLQDLMCEHLCRTYPEIFKRWFAKFGGSKAISRCDVNMKKLDMLLRVMSNFPQRRKHGNYSKHLKCLIDRSIYRDSMVVQPLGSDPEIPTMDLMVSVFTYSSGKCNKHVSDPKLAIPAHWWVMYACGDYAEKILRNTNGDLRNHNKFVDSIKEMVDRNQPQLYRRGVKTDNLPWDLYSKLVELMNTLKDMMRFLAAKQPLPTLAAYGVGRNVTRIDW